ncbi:MAG: ABC transporter permease [Thermoplasmata archaeon]
MSRTIADLKAFAIQYMRNPVGAFFALAFPIILVLVFGSVFSQSAAPEVPLPVQDLDGTATSGQLLEIMNQTGTVEISMISPTADIDDHIRDNSLSVALVIPAGFEATALSNTSVNVTLYGDQTTSSYGVVVGSVSAAVEILDRNLPIPNRAVPDQVVGMVTTDIVAEGFAFIDFFLPGMIAFTIMINGLFILSALSAEYKSRGYFKLLATTPLSKSEWILSKFLWFLIIMLISIFLMFIISIGAFGVKVSITPLALALVLAGILLFTSMGLLIGIWAKDVESASAVGNAIGFPMMFLSGIFFQLEMMPEALQVIAYALPLTYLSEGMRATMIYGNDTTALIDLAVVLILAIFFFIVASKLMSWKEK